MQHVHVGLTDAQIGDQLGVSPATVAKHLEAIPIDSRSTTARRRPGCCTLDPPALRQLGRDDASAPGLRQQSHDHPRHVVRRKATEPHIDVITLAVGDLDRSLAFYRDGLGLETTGVVATEFVDEETSAAGAIVIFRLRGGLVLALYPAANSPRTPTFPSDHRRRASSASDNSSRTEPRSMRCSAKPNRPGRLSLGDPTIALGIYSGYFRDPDGHLWEIIWNPPTENTKQ